MTNTLFCATVLYPYKAGATFDFEYYAKTLAHGYAEILGKNCLRFEVRKGLAGPGESTPRFLCIANFWVKSSEQFSASMADPGMKDMMEKISAFTDIEPFRQFDVVISDGS